MDNSDLFWLFSIIIAESFALYYVKKYSINDTNNVFIYVSIILYAYIPFALYKITHNCSGIAVTNIVWNIASTIYGLIIGMLLFDENITFEQKIGISLGFLSIIFMIWKQKTY